MLSSAHYYLREGQWFSLITMRLKATILSEVHTAGWWQRWKPVVSDPEACSHRLLTPLPHHRGFALIFCLFQVLVLIFIKLWKPGADWRVSLLKADAWYPPKVILFFYPQGKALKNTWAFYRVHPGSVQTFFVCIETSPCTVRHRNERKAFP